MATWVTTQIAVTYQVTDTPDYFTTPMGRKIEAPFTLTVRRNNPVSGEKAVATISGAVRGGTNGMTDEVDFDEVTVTGQPDWLVQLVRTRH